jgi:TonB dependent receptor
MVTVLPVTRQLLLGPNVSRNDLTTSAGFVDDTWQLNRRVTLSLGMRLDRYQPALPAQEGPAGQTFPAIAPILTFSNWGPRAGLSADLTGDGQDRAQTALWNILGLPGAHFHRGVQSQSIWLVADLPLDQRCKRERPVGFG